MCYSGRSHRLFLPCRRTGSDQMSDQSPIQRIRELDKERAALFEQAKEEALRRANQAVEDLNALGLTIAS